MNANPPVDSRTLARNALLNLAGQAIPLAIALASMPVVVRGLGPDRFGLLTLAWAILAYFGIFYLGVAKAATKFLAECLGRNERERIPAFLWSAVIIQAVAGALGAILLAAIAPALAERLLRGTPHLAREACLVFRLLAVSLPLLLLSYSFSGALEAAQRFGLTNLVRTPVQSATFLVPLAGALLGWRLPVIVGVLVAVRGLGLVALVALCIRAYGSLGSPARAGARELRALLGFGGWVTVSSVVGPALTYADRFVITAYLSVAAAGFYAGPFEVVVRLLIIPASLVTALFPAFTMIGAQGQGERLEVIASRALKYILAALGPLVIVVIAFAEPTLRLLFGPETAREAGTSFRILGGGVLVLALAHVPYQLLLGVGRPDITAKFHVLELPLQLALLWLLVPAWGIAGAAAAWCLRVVVDALLLMIATFRVSSVSLRSLASAGIGRAVAVLFVFGAAVAGASLAPVTLWMRLAFVALLAAPGGWALWRWCLDERDRSLVARVFRRATP